MDMISVQAVIIKRLMTVRNNQILNVLCAICTKYVLQFDLIVKEFDNMSNSLVMLRHEKYSHKERCRFVN